ncbi:FG-GAP repeat protein [Myxosarcina sp. GI1]|uniref:FG-GAP repeat protein n=1 Tax=Myxosarcina sp. GI1 TaxID=1541065 RepID=UPI000AFBAE82|nr:FG-GAP repeat protein [Myxosarcina sp. GI1]
MANTLFDVKDLNGDIGFKIVGLDTFDGFINDISNGGDINGDGFDDLVLSAQNQGTNNASKDKFSNYRGAVYTIFGSNNGFDAAVNINNLDESDGFVIQGLNDNDNLGLAVSNTGDINGDGLNDLIIGARASNVANKKRGVAYVVFGSSNGFDATFDLKSLDGSNGFIVYDSKIISDLGRAVSSGGDINGDGFDDFIVSAPSVRLNNNSYGNGAAYVIFGNADFDGTFDIDNLDGSNGFVIRGLNSYDSLGYALSNGGDINGDGFDDLIVGARGVDYTGAAYVIFGNDEGFDANFDLTSLNGSNGFAIATSGNEFIGLGETVSNGGDINNDGFDDFVISAPNRGVDGSFGFEGAAYVAFGNSKGFNATVNLDRLDGSNGFIIPGSRDFEGVGAVNDGGDINGDGFDDLVVGSSRATFVIFGNDSSFKASFDLNKVNSSNGLVVSGASRYGSVISNKGDINGDNLDDLIVNGSIGNNSNAYVIFGFQPLNLTGSPRNDILNGGIGNDVISGLAGNDRINGLYGDDKLSGGSGNDTLNGSAGKDTLVGETGKDLLLGDNDNDLIYGGSGNDTLNGSNGSDRLLGNLNSDRLYSGNGNDTLNGGAGNDTLVAGNGSDLLIGGNGSDRLIGVASNGNLGTGEKDTITGGIGSDIFVLGNKSGVFYDDGNSFSAGDVDYVRLKDFNSLQDKIQLSGFVGEYLLDFLPGSGDSLDAKLFYVPQVAAGSEVIAVIENVDADLSLADSAFNFV